MKRKHRTKPGRIRRLQRRILTAIAASLSRIPLMSEDEVAGRILGKEKP